MENDAQPLERRLFRSGSLDANRNALKAESLVASFAWRARNDADRIAVASPERDVTYAELDDASSQLAAALVGAGIRRGSRVALLADRGVDVPASILAILKAGAAYVPLDPSLSAHAVARIVAQTGCSVAVGGAGAASAASGGLTIVSPDAAAETVPGSLPPLEADDAACVVYATDSRDGARGVAITHGDVLALLGAVRSLFEFTPDDRFALFAPAHDGVSIFELWAALTIGATAVVVPNGVASSGAATSEMVARERITVLHQRPGAFASAAAAAASAGSTWTELRYVVFSGEPIDRVTLRRFRAANAAAGIAPSDGPRLVNMYGVMEATVFSTFKLIEELELAGDVASPLGAPLGHQEILVCDEGGSEVAPGMPGEMWIRGAGVVSGYLGNPPSGPKRFVRRLGADGPARFFRTGDLARRRPSGELEYIGPAPARDAS